MPRPANLPQGDAPIHLSSAFATSGLQGYGEGGSGGGGGGRSATAIVYTAKPSEGELSGLQCSFRTAIPFGKSKKAKLTQCPFLLKK